MKFCAEITTRNLLNSKVLGQKLESQDCIFQYFAIVSRPVERVG